MELEICQVLGNSLSLKEEPNGDQECHVYRLYERFASAASISPGTKEFSIGLYLLYLTTFSAGITKRFTAVQRVCSAIELVTRMTRDDKRWSTYLQHITTLKQMDFRECSMELAKKYVGLLNQIKPWYPEERMHGGVPST